MKFYFPTSTLNFDAIYSSMSLMPPRYHCDEAIWFPRYFKTDVDLSDEVFVLYSRPISWEISDYDSENYPMLIEVDSSIVDRILSDHVYTVQKPLPNGISCVIRNFPIVFNANDILSGCVKILFRTPEEKRTLVTRARIGVSESKLPAALKSLNIDIACETFPNDVVSFDSIKSEVQSVINSSGLMFGRKDFEEFERQDRIAGAIAGFHAGKWLRSMRDGYCLDCFRNGLDYFAWKNSLPNEFAAIIDMLCGMIGFRWNVNRDAIVDFCTKCWQKGFESIGKDEMSRHEQWHEMLRAIARSHRDTVFNYPVSGIQDAHMQALACFIKAGKSYKLLADSIRDDMIALPELALALHGALVGYSVFSRALFEKRNYETAVRIPPDTPPKPPRPQCRPDPSISPVFAQWAQLIWDKFMSKIYPGLKKNKKYICSKFEDVLKSCTNATELLRGVPSIKGFGKQSSAYRDLKMIIEEVQYGCLLPVQEKLSIATEPMTCEMPSSHMNETHVSCGSLQLIVDENFPRAVVDFVRKNLSWTTERQSAIMRDAEWLLKGYATGGCYGDIIKNPRDNVSIIRHFINLVNKNHPLSESERGALNRFLANRYK